MNESRHTRRIGLLLEMVLVRDLISSGKGRGERVMEKIKVWFMRGRALILHYYLIWLLISVGVIYQMYGVLGQWLLL